MAIKIIKDKCTGCQLCLPACPYGAIEMVDGKAKILSNCTFCGACVEACKFEAIVLEVQKEKIAGKESFKGVWIFAEARRGKVMPVVSELLGEGRKLADELNSDLSAVLIGNKVHSLSSSLIGYGADKVFVVEHEELENFRDEPFSKILVQLIKEEKPEIFLAGATAIGRSLIPKVAARLQTGLTADCTGLAIDPEKKILLQTRPAFGGNIMATIICPEKRPQMSTVRHKVMKKAEFNKSRKGKIIKKDIDGLDISAKTKVLKMVEDFTQKVNLTEANIIVSGGRGLREGKNFKLIEDLAKVLGGAVGASRSAVDAGWIPYSHQVGQTGKTVCPNIYVACGISGQIQHLAGMQSSNIIVAINKDPEAPIFKVANFGLVGDLFEIVPLLTKKFEERAN